MILRYLVVLNISIILIYILFSNFYYSNEIFLSYEKIKSKVSTMNDINIYFFKTHKTGSTTLKNILMRIKTRRKMTLVKTFENNQNHSYNRIFLDHKRFNREEAEKLFPKKKSIYITILRNPADQILSTINFYTFLKNKKKYI